MSKFNRNKDNGQFKPIYPDQAYLEALNDNGGSADTSTTASDVGCARRTAYTRLRQLESDGLVSSEKVGNSVLWKIDLNSGSDKEIVQDTLFDPEDYPPEQSSSDNAMVIAIKKPHSQAILEGRKQIEFRRSKLKPSNQPSLGFIYETSPTQSIVGLFEVESVEWLPIDELLKIGPAMTPSTKSDLQDYFQGKDHGTAIFIGDVHNIDPPIELHTGESDEWAFTPPQSFYYVNPTQFIQSIDPNRSIDV